MKLNKFILGAFLAGTLGAGMTSCSSDFLDEELTTQYSTDYFKTEDGILSLATSLYGNIRWHFGYEWAYGITLYGTDEFTNGNDLTNEPWNTYDNRFGPMACTPALGAANKNCTAPGALWDQMYYGISSCNTVIANADLIKNEESRDYALAHAYFLRGYNYYRLTAQYGGVVLQLQPTTGVVRTFNRSTEAECWEQTISDLRKAYELFKGEDFRYGKGITWTKATAAHFLAKALLFRASERCDAFNSSTKESDLQEAIKCCDYVIGCRSIEGDYRDTYANWTGIDCAIEQSDEILMAAGFNDASVTKGRFGNRTYNYFTSQFSNFSGGWVKRGYWIGGMDFQRCRPTEYTYAVYDHVNDSRMWKTFRTVFGTNTVPKGQEGAGVQPGDPGVIFILNTQDDNTYDGYTFGAFTQSPTFKDDNGRLAEWSTDARQTPTSGALTSKPGQWVPNAGILYQNGQYVAPNFKSQAICNMFAGINKTEDGSRQAEKGDAFRDVTMARVAETYLVRAECYARQGKYSEAMSDINVIRKRAQWKNGENRSYYCDGSLAFQNNGKNTGTDHDMWVNSNLDMNTYYLSNPGVAVTTEASDLTLKSFPANLPNEDEKILAKLGVSGDKDRAVQFILNERSRELIGEWQRWETLSRTKTLVARAKAFNPEAATNIKDHHILRPIPQAFIDGLLHEDGSNLTAAEKQAWQNPGYVNAAE